jgi:hypothetical protein
MTRSNVRFGNDHPGLGNEFAGRSSISILCGSREPCMVMAVGLAV